MTESDNACAPPQSLDPPDESVPPDNHGEPTAADSGASVEHVVRDLLVAAATNLLLATAAAPADRSRLVTLAGRDVEMLSSLLDRDNAHSPASVRLIAGAPRPIS